MDIMEIIESRHSVRQYIDRRIEQEKRDVLDGLCRQINSEAGLNIQLLYDEPQCFNTLLAHYGLFKDVKNYIAIVGPDGDTLEEKSGYYGEMLVLKCQELGLNTCWVALTHGKSKATVGKGEKQSIIIAMGYGKNQGRQHKNKAIKKLAQMDENSPEWYTRGVKAALMAPTAVNQQKFKIELVGDTAKITAPSGHLTKMDLGIVRYHFEAASGHKTI